MTELIEESSYTSPIKTAKRENRNEVPLIADNRNRFVEFVLNDVNMQTGANLIFYTEKISEEDELIFKELVRRPKTVCLISLIGHIEPVTSDNLDWNVLREKISDSFEMIPCGNLTVIMRE